MITLGIVLFILALIVDSAILWIIGGILVVLGVIFDIGRDWPRSGRPASLLLGSAGPEGQVSCQLSDPMPETCRLRAWRKPVGC